MSKVQGKAQQEKASTAVTCEVCGLELIRGIEEWVTEAQGVWVCYREYGDPVAHTVSVTA